MAPVHDVQASMTSGNEMRTGRVPEAPEHNRPMPRSFLDVLNDEEALTWE